MESRAWVAYGRGGWEVCGGGVLILPQVESRGEEFVRGNRRSVDPPASDYPPS